MKITAKTNNGFLVEMTESEVKEIMRSTGTRDPKPDIGTELPCRDYASQIVQIKTIQESSDYKYMISHYESVGKVLKRFDESATKLKV